MLQLELLKPELNVVYSRLVSSLVDGHIYDNSTEAIPYGLKEYRFKISGIEEYNNVLGVEVFLDDRSSFSFEKSIVPEEELLRIVNSSGTNARGFTSTYWLGQSFLVGTALNFDKLLVKLRITSFFSIYPVTATLTLSVRSDVNGLPGNIIFSNIMDVQIPADNQFVDAIFTFGSGSFLVGTYWIVLSGTIPSGILFTLGTETDVYAGGKYIASSDSGLTWSEYGADLVFDISFYKENTFTEEDKEVSFSLSLKRGKNKVEVKTLAGQTIIKYFNCWNLHLFLWLWSQEFIRVNGVVDKYKSDTYLSTCSIENLYKNFGEFAGIRIPQGYNEEQYRELLRNLFLAFDYGSSRKAVTLVLDAFGKGVDLEVLEYNKQRNRLNLSNSFKVSVVAPPSLNYRCNSGQLFIDGSWRTLGGGEGGIPINTKRYLYIDGSLDSGGYLRLRSSNDIFPVSAKYIVAKITSDATKIISIDGSGRIGERRSLLTSKDFRGIDTTLKSEGLKRLGYEVYSSGVELVDEGKENIKNSLKKVKLTQSLGYLFFDDVFYNKV